MWSKGVGHDGEGVDRRASNYQRSRGIEGMSEQNDENSQKDMGAIRLQNEDSVVSEAVR